MRIAILIAVLLVAIHDTARAQTPEHEPGSIVFVIDRSGSMYEEIASEKRAVLDAIAALDPTDLVSVVAYNYVATVVFSDAVAKRTTLKKSMSTITAEGGTSIVAGLGKAFEVLGTATTKRKHVIVLAEGAPEDDEDDTLADLLPKMRLAGITISCVGIVSADRDLMARIAGSGGGRFSMVRKLSQLSKTLSKEARQGLQ